MKRTTTLNIESRAFKQFKKKLVDEDLTASAVFRKFIKNFNENPRRVIEFLK